MPTVPISSDVLTWAADQSGWDRLELADQLKVDVVTLSAWLKGADLPTTTEFRRIVQTLKRPSAIFFLPSAPLEAGLGPEYRSAPGATGRRLTPQELDSIRATRHLQRGLREVAVARQSNTIVLPSLRASTSPDEAADLARRLLGVATESQMEWESPRQAMDAWRSAFADLGIHVVQLQIGREAIRGFSLWDDYVPVIAVNTTYNHSARVFSVFHEFGHMLRRSFAACVDLTYRRNDSTGIERWCEQFAAAALMPANEAKRIATRIESEDRLPFVVALADAFNVSIRAAALRAADLGLVDNEGLYEEVNERARVWDREKGFGRGTTNSVDRRLAELGPPALETFISAYDAEQLTERDLRRYVRLDGPDLTELRERLAESRG